MRCFRNPRSRRDAYSDEERRVTSRAAAEVARTEVMRWPGFAPSPIRSLDADAATLGLAAVLMKDESGRLGQGSFKSLGGAYAATRMLESLPGPASGVTLCCATEGNHGRSVAFAAKRLGCRAVVFMHERALDYKVAAIEALGASVVRTPGNYDDSVVVAAAEAERNGWLLVSDTHDEDNPAVLRVMHGYGVMALELLEQFSEADFPTHIFLQAGVGGLATGVIGVLSEVLGAARPTFVVVEPATAACVQASAVIGAPAQLTTPVDTVMQMLAVGNASPAAWPVLDRRADFFVTVSDDEARAARMRLLGGADGEPLNIGFSGVAGLAGLHAVAGGECRAAIGLDAGSRVLVFGTEAGPATSAVESRARTNDRVLQA